MKEAEKEAEKIIEMFLNVKSNKINDHSKIEYPTAKQCAIIYVEGRIEEIEDYAKLYGVGLLQTSLWQEVKQAIEKANELLNEKLK